MPPSPRPRSEAARVARFGGVGAITTLLYAAAAWGLGAAGLAAELASVVAYLAAATVGFLAHRSFTFRARGDMAPQVGRFAAASAGGLLIALLAPVVIVRGLGGPDWASVIATCMAVPVFSYLALALFVFGGRPGGYSEPT